MAKAPKFTIGQLVQHKLFGYRGVIVDIDSQFALSEQWYERMARSRPPKDRPWYSVLVHDADHQTYVAERNLEPDPSGEPVQHPALREFFDAMRGGYYLRERDMN
ncbi:MAG: heat shock protein HspQ [Proteobacteria bacterium]|nr:heat shock protein HspQ [Pseudomonadota bacterium]